MNEIVKKEEGIPSINWKAFGSKIWDGGIKKALQEEVVPKTENTWDDMAVKLIDQIVGIVLR